MRACLVLASLWMCACYASHELGDAGPRTDAGGLAVCFSDEQVFDAPLDGACHDWVITSPAAHAGCNGSGDRRFRAFRVGHPAQVRDAYVTITCAGSTCDGELDLPYWQASSDCTRCPATFSRGPIDATDAMQLHLALVDAHDGSDREPEYLVGRPPTGSGEPTFVVTLCSVPP